MPMPEPDAPDDDAADEVAVDTFLAAVLARAKPAWRKRWTGRAAISRFVARAEYHGVAALLADSPDLMAGWPAPAADALNEQALVRAMWEMRHRALLGALLEQLAQRGVAALLLKGTALAYDVYANPVARMRGDTDLLVAPEDRPAARAALAQTGFSLQDDLSELDGNWRLQEIWSCGAGGLHAIDLHWQAINSRVIGGILPTRALFERARPLPQLGPHALAPARADLLLHAIVHRAGHATAPYFSGGDAHFSADRLIWLVDVDLLARAMDEKEWGRFCNAARRAGIAAMCRQALADSASIFATPVPCAALDSLSAPQPRGIHMRYLCAISPVRRSWMEVAAVPGWRARAAYLLARIFPRAAFLRARYSELRGWPLPLLYARRIAELLMRR